MTARWVIVAGLLALTAGCGGESQPNDPFDGSFIGGDAEPVDAEIPRDAGVPDVGPPPDTGVNVDAGFEDATLPDADICGTPAVATVTASAARSQAAALAGQVIALTGTATQAGLQCTDRACPPEDPCCNTCVADVLVDGVRLAGSACFDPAPGCTGSECAQTCRPPLLGLPQTFRGVLSTSAPDRLELQLFRVE